MTHHDKKLEIEEPKAKKGNTGITGDIDFPKVKEDVKKGEGEGVEKKSEIEEGEKIKEFDFKAANLNKVGIKNASDLNAIDTLDTTFAQVGEKQDLKIDLAEEYEKVKA